MIDLVIKELHKYNFKCQVHHLNFNLYCFKLKNKPLDLPDMLIRIGNETYIFPKSSMIFKAATLPNYGLYARLRRLLGPYVEKKVYYMSFTQSSGVAILGLQFF